jgi:16S rRNA (cytosine1402-N4)-methyltransferase
MESPYSARFPCSPLGRENPANASPPGGCQGTKHLNHSGRPRRTRINTERSTMSPTPQDNPNAGEMGQATPSTAFVHEPVMVEQITDLFAPVPAGWMVDATVGGGGHAGAVLDAHHHVQVLGLDQDPDALDATGTRLSRHRGRLRLRRTRFDRLAESVASEAIDPVVAVLFDLGVSSPQFDRAERGFSYRNAGPLDMRMDPDQSLTADDIVNQWPAADLVALLRRNSDERHASRIARNIVAHRPIANTAELAEVVRDAIPAAARRRGGHPAKRTFQALRIEVNDELAILADSIDQAIDVLAPGGRLAVLSYHSGEDRIVKQRLRHAATGGCHCPPSLPCGCGAVPTLRLLRPGGWAPAADEIERNPRAASARLRAGEKLDVEVAA